MILSPAEQLGGACACGAATTTNVARIAMCDECATTLLDLVRGQLVARRDGVGLGRQSGPLLEAWGPNWARIECELCEASWVGPIGEACGWCMRRVKRLRVEQRELLLRPDLPALDDEERRLEALKAWGSRLRVGHEAGVITRGELDVAWRRETK